MAAERFDVAVVGAGPVGLMLANMLGAAALRVVVIEALPELINYPRGVGMDDECLRAFQSIGLAGAIQPHTTPFHIMRIVTGKGRVFAEFDPQTDEFGWPRRNAFIQPLIDAELAKGTKRYANVEIRFARTVERVTQDRDAVTLALAGGEAIVADYLVGSDGGRSFVRKELGIAFEGETNPNRWIVVDIADDPMGLPNAYLHADPARPYASIALPHGIRRLEFMLFDGEGEDGEVPRDVLNQMLARVMPHPERINLIRARIYTHNGRLAERFREGRALLAGDAAHIMPVWQGQGYNSGVRDAANLGWKLALVANGICGPRLLDSYGAERREHARAMINLSDIVGRVFAVRNPVVAAVRDGLTWLANKIPSVRSYFLQMKFKPMPRYKEGALYYGPGGYDSRSPVGRMFIQPRVTTAAGVTDRLDELIGGGRFALICWGVNPVRWLSADSRAMLDALGTEIIWTVPMTQLAFEAERHRDVLVLGDSDRRMKKWFDRNDRTMVLLRPDRFVALNCGPQEIDEQLPELAKRLDLSKPALQPQQTELLTA